MDVLHSSQTFLRVSTRREHTKKESNTLCQSVLLKKPYQTVLDASLRRSLPDILIELWIAHRLSADGEAYNGFLLLFAVVEWQNYLIKINQLCAVIRHTYMSHQQCHNHSVSG